MAHQDPNYVAENPFEGRGRASQRNDAIDSPELAWAYHSLSSLLCSSSL